MGTLYKIRNWDTQYENNRTRELKTLSWVPIPNKHDSDGYTQVMCEENPLELYGAWVVIVQLASRCGVRGTLLRDGAGPHNSASIARITRTSEKSIARALDYFSTSVNWLIVEDYKECDNPAPTCDNPAGGCLEGNGTEGNRREVGGAAPTSRGEVSDQPPSADVGIPTLEECREYATNPACAFPVALVQEFYDKQLDRGWGNDWRARMRGAVATWNEIAYKRKVVRRQAGADIHAGKKPVPPAPKPETLPRGVVEVVAKGSLREAMQKLNPELAKALEMDGEKKV